jgi:biotin operon repressor
MVYIYTYGGYMATKIFTKELDEILISNYDNYSIKELALQLKVCRVSIWKRAKELGLSKKRKVQIKYHGYTKHIIEKIKDFGFDVLEIKNKKWLIVKCPNCTNSFKSTYERLKSRHTQSCGCLKGKKKRQGTKNISKTFFTRLLDGANKRNIEVNISIDDLENLIIKQNFKCFYTGWDISIGYQAINKITASVDRIDSSKPYILNNICFVHKDINRIKQHYSIDYFKQLCKAVTEWQSNY